ncbi:Glycosyl transferase family 2 [Lachnospiraceae bacterium XBB2008]|nr:Glycosyl transferase family 2 [Lachnospiraceae bacterium XBB2008]
MRDYLVTTITPCHNSAAYLDECWESLKNQTIGVDKMQIIFVDDASDDDGETVAKLSRFESEYPDHVTVICLDENLRQGGARNVALKYASGKYIQFLDSDDTLDHEALQQLCDLAGKYDVDLIHYHATYLNDDRLVEIPDSETRKTFLASGIYSCGHNHKLYSRDLIEKTGSSFAERLIYEEPKFVYPLYFFAKRILFLKKNYTNTRIHSASTMTTMAGSRVFDHAEVQLQLLESLIERTDIFNEYYHEIEEYFIWSFFYETMVSIIRIGMDNIDVNKLIWLKETVKTVFPRWEENPYINAYSQDRWEILSLINM